MSVGEAMQFITFRLGDSLPKEKLLALEMELALLPASSRDLERRKKLDQWLDSGMGCCALGHPRMANVMQETLQKFHGERYELIAWCIMPNHVHVLIEAWESLSKIVQSWKSFTGRWAMANAAELGLGIPGQAHGRERKGPGSGALGTPYDKKDAELGLGGPRKDVGFGRDTGLGDPGKGVRFGRDLKGRWFRKDVERGGEPGVDVPGGKYGGRSAGLRTGSRRGNFWMREYWDRYIRDERHFHAVVRYIHENPVKAGLCQRPEDWLWSSLHKKSAFRET